MSHDINCVCRRFCFNLCISLLNQVSCHVVRENSSWALKVPMGQKWSKHLITRTISGNIIGEYHPPEITEKCSQDPPAGWWWMVAINLRHFPRNIGNFIIPINFIFPRNIGLLSSSLNWRTHIFQRGFSNHQPILIAHLFSGSTVGSWMNGWISEASVSFEEICLELPSGERILEGQVVSLGSFSKRMELKNELKRNLTWFNLNWVKKRWWLVMFFQIWFFINFKHKTI